MLIKSEFESIADLFFAQGKDKPGGSSLAIFENGEPVLNLWQGQADENHAWTEKTYSVIFSCTKGLASIMAHRLVQEGKLDLEEKVSKYWPEFAQSGKENIPVKWLLQHKAGLSAVRRDLTIDEITDGHTLEEELARQEPLWKPGTAHAYHALTFGTLVGKLIHNITGKSAGAYFRELITDPLNVDAWIGLPPARFDNLAPLITDGKRVASNAERGTNEYWLAKSMTFGGALDYKIESYETGFNNPKLIQAELPGAGGVSNAFALAKIYSAAATKTDGVRLLSDEIIRAATVPQSTGALMFEGQTGPFPAWGNGFMLDAPGFKDMLGPGSFGHDGLGGQCAFGDIDHRIGFAYTTNYLQSGPQEQSRQQEIIRKLKAILV
ncbi:MAG: serine hydrolase domain-containing protein [Rhodoluna sp.]